MTITIENSKGTTKRKILNFQLAGEELHVNYKVGSIKTEKSTATQVSETYKAIIQSDIVSLRTSTFVSVVRDSKVLFSYTKTPTAPRKTK